MLIDDNLIEEDLIEDISAKDFDQNYYVKRCLVDTDLRESLIYLMIHHEHIMVYYHCYFVLNQVSSESPEFFYDHFDDFLTLLDHKNSYHRDIGLTMLANISTVDTMGKLDNVFDRYSLHFNDDKMMTAQCFIKNIGKIALNKPDLVTRIVELLLRVDVVCSYTTKQVELLKSDIIEVLDPIYKTCTLSDQNRIMQFVHSQVQSVSPKTKKNSSSILQKP